MYICSSSASTARTCYRVVTQQSSRSCSLTSTDLFRQLHWLSIEWGTKFKLACLTYKALHTGHPPYLAELLQYHKPARSTCSSASHSLSVLRHNLSFGSRAVRISAPKIWKSLPPFILQSQTLSSFRRHLKTHYFQSAYPAPYHPSPMRPDSLLRLWRYINHLLTYLL